MLPLRTVGNRRFWRTTGVTLGIFAALMIAGTLAGGGTDIGFMSLWLFVLLIAAICSNGVGWRFALGAVVGSLLLGCIAAPYLAGNSGDQVVRKKVFQLLPVVGQFLAFPAIIIALQTTIGFVIGSFVWCVMERRWIQLACSGLLAVGIIRALLPALQAACPSSLSWSPPPPLGPADYDQYNVVNIAGPPAERRARFAEVDFETLENVSYGPHGLDNQLDLYLPKGGPNPEPVVVCIHGGWGGERKEVFREVPQWMVPLLKRGIAVAPINFRWLADHRFPAQIQDCNAAIRFLRASADKYGLDPDHIGVLGHSCGSHLAALVAGATDVPEFMSDGWNLNVSTRVQAVVMSAALVDIRTWTEQARLHLRCCNFPGSDYAFSERPDGESAIIHMLLGGSVEERPETAHWASPVQYVTKNHPPTFLVNGFRDGNAPPHQAEYYHCLLRSTEVESELLIIPGDGHHAAMRAGTPIATFFEKHLKPNRAAPKASAID
jgi:acetyl esterase/lipase